MIKKKHFIYKKKEKNLNISLDFSHYYTSLSFTNKQNKKHLSYCDNHFSYSIYQFVYKISSREVFV